MIQVMSSTKMMNCRFKRPGAAVRFFCFPWAGGGSNFYAGWGKLITDNVEVVGITLPGRESRFSDPCCSDLEQTINDITHAIRDHYLDKPYMFWGHSMGALLAFEAARQMKVLTGREPEKLYLSGVSAPHSPMRKRFNMDASVSDDDFVVFLRKLGGTPTELLENKDMMKIVIPCLRADYSLIDQVIYSLPESQPELTCPIAFFDGEDDVKHDIDGWRKVTSGGFSLTMLPGGHFYLREKSNMETIIAAIDRDYSEEHEIV